MRHRPWTVRAGAIYLLVVFAIWIFGITGGYLIWEMDGLFTMMISGGMTLAVFAIAGLIFFGLLELARVLVSLWQTREGYEG